MLGPGQPLKKMTLFSSRHRGQGTAVPSLGLKGLSTDKKTLFYPAFSWGPNSISRALNSTISPHGEEAKAIQMEKKKKKRSSKDTKITKRRQIAKIQSPISRFGEKSCS